MTDFLTNILDRTFSRAAVLQRRRPSLFEPARDERDVTHGRVGGHEENVAAQLETHRPLEGETTPPARSIPLSPPAPLFEADELHRARLEPVLPLEMVPPRAAPKTGSRRTVDDEDATPALGREPAEAVQGDPPALAIETRNADPGERPSLERPSVLGEIRLAASFPTRALEQPAAMQSIEAETAGETGALRQKQRPDIQRAPLPMSGRASRPAPPSLRPTVRASRLQPIGPNPSTMDAPSVQVTIGRLEVRVATAPVAAVPSARPPVPRLSLDEYLRSRSGGVR